MAMKKKAKPREGAGKMALKPELQPGYVRKQLEDAAGIGVPKALVDAVVEAGKPPKLRAVAKILMIMKETEGTDFPQALKSMNGETAGLLVRRSDALVKMGRYASDSDRVFSDVLYGRRTTQMLEKTPQLLVEIAYAAGTSSRQAFRLLNYPGVADAFDKNPKAVAERFVRAARICGRKAGLFFDVMGTAEMREVFASEPKKAMEIAEAGTYTTLLQRIKGDAGVRKMAASGEALKNLGRFSRVEAIGDGSKKNANPKKVGIGLAKYRGRWKKGMEAAKAAGVKGEDREVFMNFAYALEKVGREKAIALHREFGIEYFARYSKAELEGMYKEVGKEASLEKVVLVAYAKYDEKMEMYAEKSWRKYLARDGAKVIFFEAGDEEEFYDIAKRMSERYLVIEEMMIAGERIGDSTRLGPGEGEKHFIDPSDVKEQMLMEKIVSGKGRVA